MITLEAERQVEPAAWRALLATLGGTPFHLPEVWVGSVVPEAISHLIWWWEGEQVAAAVAITMEKRFFGLFRGERTLSLPVAPCLAPGAEALRGEVYGALIAHAREAGCRVLTVDPRWGDNVSDLPLLRDQVSERLVEFTVDLRQQLAALSRGLHKKHRKHVALAEGQELELVEDRSLEAFLRLRKMQQSSAERASERGNPYGIQDVDFYRRSWETVYRDGPGRVLFARRDGEDVAALAYLAFDRKAVTVRSGSTAQGYETGAMFLLQFELFRRLPAAGIEVLNIGGVPAEAADAGHPQHGLYNYKRYYGGRPCLSTGLKIRL